MPPSLSVAASLSGSPFLAQSACILLFSLQNYFLPMAYLISYPGLITFSSVTFFSISFSPSQSSHFTLLNIILGTDI